jgi:hypothetical protein
MKTVTDSHPTSSGTTAEQQISDHANAEAARILRKAGMTTDLLREVVRHPQLRCLAPVATAMEELDAVESAR